MARKRKLEVICFDCEARIPLTEYLSDHCPICGSGGNRQAVVYANTFGLFTGNTVDYDDQAERKEL